MYCNKPIQCLKNYLDKTSILKKGLEQQNYMAPHRERNLEFERTRVLPENKSQKLNHIEGNALQQTNPVFKNYYS